MPPSNRSENALFESARHIIDPRERARFLSAACGRNEPLRRQVELLLSLQAEADLQFEQSPVLPRAITDALTAEPEPDEPPLRDAPPGPE